MMPPKKRVIVFDFDGVVADSSAQHLACWRTVLKKHGAELPEELYAIVVGWSPREIAQTIVRKTDAGVKPEQLAEEKQALYLNKAVKELQPMAGAKDALQRLRGEYPIAITASMPRKFVESVLERFGMTGCADTMITREDIGDEEELDDVLAVAVAQLGSAPDDAVMIDDSRNGILAAKRIGMKAIAFDSHQTMDLDYSMADAQVNSLDELVPELIGQVLST